VSADLSVTATYQQCWIRNTRRRRSIGLAASLLVIAGTVASLTGTAAAAQKVPAGTLGVIKDLNPASGVAASAPTVTSSGPCDGKVSGENTIAVYLFSPSLNATRPDGQAVQSDTTTYSTTDPMRVPFGNTFTDAFQAAGATIKGGEQVEIRMVCQNKFSVRGGTFRGSVTFNADASRYTFDAPAAQAATTTMLNVSPASPAASGTQETLTASVSPTSAAGSVQFRDGSTAIGAPVTVNNGVSSTTTKLADGSHSLTAVFTPTDTTAFGGSTSATVAYTVNGAVVTPPPSVPEVPVAALLPLVGLAAVGGTVLVRRRRTAGGATA